MGTETSLVQQGHAVHLEGEGLDGRLEGKQGAVGGHVATAGGAELLDVGIHPPLAVVVDDVEVVDRNLLQQDAEGTRGGVFGVFLLCCDGHDVPVGTAIFEHDGFQVGVFEQYLGDVEAAVAKDGHHVHGCLGTAHVGQCVLCKVTFAAEPEALDAYRGLGKLAEEADAYSVESEFGVDVLACFADDSLFNLVFECQWDDGHGGNEAHHDDTDNLCYFFHTYHIKE